MTQWKDVGRRVGRSSNVVHRAAGTVIESLEQRLLLASAPVMDWSTYFGGGSVDVGRGIATDSDGNVWVAGWTASTDLATGGFDNTYNGGTGDGFVAKINANETLAWSTYLGGSGSDTIYAIAIDGGGNAWVAGRTDSTDLASGGLDSTYHGGGDDFVAKINADGTLAWLSYLGGSGEERVPHIAIDTEGNAWVTGITASTDFASGGFDTTYNGGSYDGFVAKINASGTLAWSSYLGGINYDGIQAIAIDEGGNAWVTGGTGSPGWTSGGFDTTFNGLGAGFVAKINADGTLAWSSYLYLGTNATDSGNAIAFDGDGSAWILGVLGSLAKINADGTLAWSNSNGEDISRFLCAGIAIDDTGNAWITGSDLVPNTPPNVTLTDAFVARINAAGTWNWLAYVGGPHRPSGNAGEAADSGFGIAIDANGAVWVTGQTGKSGWTSGGFDTTLSGATDAFVLKLIVPQHAPVASDQSLTTAQGSALNGTATATDEDDDALTYSPVTQPAHGTLSLQPDGTFTYTPAADFYGLDSFTFKANDGKLDSNIATISITITPDPQANLSLSPASIPENQPSGTTVGTLGVTGPYATAPFTYTLVTGTGGTDNASFTISGAVVLSAATFDYETKSTYSVRVGATDSGGRYFEKALTISITNVNEAPTNLTLSATTIPENQPSGTTVGTLGTTDPDTGNTFTYSLVSGSGSADNASFTITGNQLKTATSFDFETKSTYSVRLRTTDQGGLSFEKAFTITVTDVNEAPTDISLSSASVAENLPVGTFVATLSATDPDAGSTFTYSLVSGTGGTDNASFSISLNTLRTAASFNSQLKNSYSIRLRTTDQGGLWFEKVFTITVTDVNQTPTDISLSSTSIPENQPAATTVGTLSTTDPDTGDTFTYTLASGTGSSGNASFQIVGNQLQTAASFDYESQSNYLIRVRTTDQGGLWFEKAFVIAVTNVNEAPTNLALSNATVPENQPAGTLVGSFSTSDPDAGDTFNYLLVSGTGSTDNASFQIVGNQLRTAASFNFEAQSSYAIRVRSTDAGGLSFEKALTISVTNVNEAPSDLALSSTSISENQPVGTPVGTLTATDPDSGNTFSYILVGGAGSTDNASFTISGTTLQTAAVFDYAAKNSYHIRIRTTDQGALWFEKAFTITVINVNAAPTDIALSPASVPENRPAGTTVGTLSCTDPDAGDTSTYTLVSGTGGGADDNASFTISGNHLLTAGPFDYESKNNYSIRIRATDAGGLYVEKAFTITVSNVNERPTDVALSNASVPENQPAGTAVGTLSGIDPDTGDAFTYTLVTGTGDDGNASFTISGNQLLTAASFDHEAQGSFSIRIRTTDAGGLYVEKAFVIDVTDANDAPTDLALSNTVVQENLPSGTVVGAFSTVDPDAGDTFTYTLVSGPGDQDNASFVIDAGQLTTAKRFNYEFRKNYSIRVCATDSGGLSYEKPLNIDISDDPTDYRGAFGWTGGKKRTTLVLVDATDGDLVTFKLSGTGTGKVYGFQGSFEDLFVTGSGPTTGVTITVKNAKVKKPLRGDKLMTLGNITTDGILKTLNSSASILCGLVQFNTRSVLAGKAKLSMKLRQITDSDIRVQGLPVSSIAVKGDVTGTRILTTASIQTLKMATLLNSDILVGVATDCAEHFATADDFANRTARLGNLKVSGRKLPSKTSHPTYVANSHISAPSVGAIALLNVPAASDPLLHVLTDTGTLTVTRSKLTSTPMFAPGTWKKPGQRPLIWEVVG